jgi:hypothetical protein
LFIKGAGTAVGYYPIGSTLNLFIEGDGDPIALPVDKSLDLFIKGEPVIVYSTNKSMTLYLKVLDGEPVSGELDMFIEGSDPNVVSANLDLVIYSTMIRETLTLFTRGI